MSETAQTEAVELGPLTDDALTGDFRITQRKRGHRYSLDDVLTAYEATRPGRPFDAPARYLDLGCGIGSVLLMVSWRDRPSEIVGLEAQEISFGMVKENVARNGVDARLVHGDLRDEAARAQLGGPFDLVTGTPPYMPPGTATPSPDTQRAHARVELRGGVEDYLDAAASLVREGGHIVVCCDARFPGRVLDHAPSLGLVPLRQVDAIPRAGHKGALFSVFTLRRGGAPAMLEEAPFTARDVEGARSDAYRAVRAHFGLPGQPPPAAKDPR